MTPPKTPAEQAEDDAIERDKRLPAPWLERDLADAFGLREPDELDEDGRHMADE